MPVPLPPHLRTALLPCAAFRSGTTGGSGWVACAPDFGFGASNADANGNATFGRYTSLDLLDATTLALIAEIPRAKDPRWNWTLDDSTGEDIEIALEELNRLAARFAIGPTGQNPRLLENILIGSGILLQIIPGVLDRQVASASGAQLRQLPPRPC